MADDITGAVAPTAATIPNPAAPAAAASVSPVTQETPPAVPLSAAPPVEPPSNPEAPPSAAVASSEPSLLGAEPPKTEKAADPEKAPDAKAAEAAKADGTEQKKEEGSQSGEPAPLPTFEAFTLPEGFQKDDGRLGEFTKELAEFELTAKADHAQVQALGQKFLNQHVAEMQRMHDFYRTAFDKQVSDWKDSFQKDPEIGGNRAETSVKAAREFIHTHGGTEAQQAEFRQLMNTTGVGNHPSLIRILAKANAVLGEGKPLAASKPVPAPQGKAQRRYSGA